MELTVLSDEICKGKTEILYTRSGMAEAELAEEKISVYMDKAQLEKDLDELVKTSLMYGKVRNLEMKIQGEKDCRWCWNLFLG